MPLRSYRPTSPGLRQMTRSTFDEITKDTPHKPLTERSFSKAGRNAQGKLTVRHQGSGHKRLYRIIDWKRDKPGVPARIATVEYDPNRSARIGLLALRRRREALHAPAARARGRRSRRLRPGRGGADRQRPPTVAGAARHAGPQHRARRRPRRPDRALRRQPAHSCSPRRASSRPSACRRARCAACASTAWRRWAR